MFLNYRSDRALKIIHILVIVKILEFKIGEGVDYPHGF